ncbi:MAG: deoxyribonuclease IV [Desulfobacteraceae bacterium]
MPRLGAHMSIAGGLYRAPLRGGEAGCEVIQIFTRNRNRWNSKKLSAKEIDLFHRACEETSILAVAAHNSYLINLASARSHVLEKSFRALLQELERAELLEIPYLVMHPGAHVGDGEKKGLRRIADALNRVFERMGDYRVRILLEMTAGQGTSLGYRLEHLAEILEMTEAQERLGVCMDTCHAFAAGYDFRSAKAYRQFFGEFDRILGLDRLRLFHLNDSKNGLGSRVDRHEHPGAGFIGLKAFSFFLNDPKLAHLPFLIETPKGKNKDGLDWDMVNLNLLRRQIKKATINDSI